MKSSTDLRHLRSKQRFKIFQPATLRHQTTISRAHILDLSASGALLHSSAELDLGSYVRVELNNWSRGARVEWREGAKLGVRFDHLLADTEVEELVSLPLA